MSQVRLFTLGAEQNCLRRFDAPEGTRPGLEIATKGLYTEPGNETADFLRQRRGLVRPAIVLPAPRGSANS